MPDSFLSALIVCSTGASALWVAASAPARQEDARYGTLIVTVVATGIGLVSALTGHPNAQVDWAWAMSTVYIMARNDLQHTTYAAPSSEGRRAVRNDHAGRTHAVCLTGTRFVVFLESVNLSRRVVFAFFLIFGLE